LAGQIFPTVQLELEAIAIMRTDCPVFEAKSYWLTPDELFQSMVTIVPNDHFVNKKFV